MSKTNKEKLTFEPDEINEYKKIVQEYVEKVEAIESEIDTLVEDKKELKKQFEEKIDLKTLNQVLRILKIESRVSRKDTFDLMKDALKDLSE